MLPETTSQQRQEMYEDITELVTVGFLSAPVRVGPLNLNFRSLNDGDLYLLRQRTAFIDGEDFRRWLLATSTWMVGGQILLSDPNAALVCFNGFRSLRPVHSKILTYIIDALMTRQSRCYALLEAFLLEGASRSLWRQTGGIYPSSTYSGLPVRYLGMNVVQKIWLAHNRMEDIREQVESDWAHAKLVASASSPKGVEQLNQKEQTMRQTAKERKQELLDRTYYKWIGYLKEDGTVKGMDVPVFRQASTSDELADEMRKWVSGELDFHDRVVAEYKQFVLDSYEREMAERQQRVEEVRRQLDEQGEDTEAITLVGYTLDQLRERVQPTLRKTVYENPKGATFLYDRYGGPVSSGTLAVQDGKVVVKEPSSLDEQIAGRDLTYKG